MFIIGDMCMGCWVEYVLCKYIIKFFIFKDAKKTDVNVRFLGVGVSVETCHSTSLLRLGVKAWRRSLRSLVKTIITLMT